MTAASEMLSRLDAFFAAQDGVPGTVSNLVKTSLGRSRENWSFDLVGETGSTGEAQHTGDAERVRAEPLVLRRDPLGGLVETDRAREYAVLCALHDTDVPAPRARWLDERGEFFGRPSMIMRREPGTCEYRVLSGSRPAPERVALARSLCELLARVHEVDWPAGTLGELFDDPGAEAALVELERWEAVLRRDQVEAYPELELALHRLRATAPRSPRTVVVHGDFKPGNVLLDGIEVTALLDWELAHLGDPHEDLGWVTQPLRRREQVVDGHWEEREILDCYEHATGWTVDRAAVRWWATFATFRTAVMQVSGLRAFLDGRADESYRPTAGVLRALLEAIGEE